MYYYIYILQSEKDNQFITGYTSNLKERLKMHNEGKVTSTKNRVPLKLVYFEGCINQQDATHREKYLKTSWGKRYLKTRLLNYLTGWTDLELIFSMLGEASTSAIVKTKNPIGFIENKKVAKQGGEVAGNARKELEEKTGEQVVSNENYLLVPEKSKKKIKWFIFTNI